ncbi:MAG: DUF624 domain-containing protein [Ruminococcaceae bacterium]|nr:DUF624 domain-containing protein [Oscillospiraceae bacterium]
MAGLFGFLDFTREGPGIRKDAPKKKTFFVFFETFFRNFWRFFSINLVYFLTSIPILTNGMATAGITNITRNIARDKHSFGLSDFFETIKRNWKQSLAVGIINTIITALLLFGIWFYNESYLQTQQTLSLAGLIMVLIVFAIFGIMNFYIYTLMITFNFKLKSLYTNSFKFVFVNLWKNLLCGICVLLIYGLYIFLALLFADIRVWLIEFIIMVSTLPAFKYLLIQFFTFGSIKKYIIDPYYKEHPDADIEKRRNLGLEVPDDDEEEPLSWE